MAEKDGFNCPRSTSPAAPHPRRLGLYGVTEDAYSHDAEDVCLMIHACLARIIKSTRFHRRKGNRAILSNASMDGEVERYPYCD